MPPSGVFSQGVWKELDRACVGVDMLKDRLTKVLENHIMAQLPGVLKDVDKGVKKCTEELSGLGPSRMSTSTQRQYLMEASAKFTRLISDAVYAQYSDPYFATGAEPYTKRLRAVVQNSLSDFAKEMLQMGQAALIVEAAPANKSREVVRSTYMERVALKRVIDDFSVLVVESCVLQRLLNLLSSDTIRNLDDATIKDIAQESDSSAAARTRLQDRLEILQGGLVVLRKLEQGMQTVAQVEHQLPCTGEDLNDVQDSCNRPDKE
ncbi:unnamed protein product [Parascedosporium putredinis]|uniref:GED domain-containing protein n=1 Tax=Parascedosporium putredinis TaxID=1442378 RepID=A0A9P1H2T1_9PEZI|nr:unnamed protein product [Parascedosporium putredinis]CAI7993910.1 unnamed protein product [Parascedosporium putredinis]